MKPFVIRYPHNVAEVAVPVGKPRLVGRASELAVLESELRGAFAGEFRAVLITAEPGIGKTRLATELLERHSRSVYGLRARAYSLGSASTLGLWVEALERQLKLLTPDELRRVCGGVLDDLAVLFRSAAAVSISPPGTEPPRLRLMEGVAVVVDNLSRGKPVVVFLDDVHLADASSLEALDYMTRSLVRARVLVVAAARRSELTHNRVANEVLSKLEQDGQLRRLRLSPLGRDALGQLAEQVFHEGRPTEALVDWLEQRSRGHPLFALGLLRALQEEGADLSAPRLRRLPEDLGERVVASMEFLDEPALSILELLAVQARRVELHEIADLVDEPADRLASSLELLTRARFVIEEDHGGLVVYDVAHPLIQEAVYERIGAARRRLLHRQVARALLDSSQLTEAAPHFVRSADACDDEAIDALLSAIRQAQQRDAHREAMTIVRALIEILPRGDSRWPALLDVIVWQGSEVLDHRVDIDRETVPTTLHEIEVALAGSADLATMAALRYGQSNHLAYDVGDLAAAEASCRQSLELYERAGDRAGALTAALELAWIVGAAGDLPGLAREAQTLVEKAEQAGDHRSTMLATTVLAHACFLQGHFRDAEAALQRSLDVARSQGHVQRIVSNLSLLAQTLAFEGRMPTALTLLKEARTEDADYGVTLLPVMSARIQWLAGDFESAIQSATEAISWARGGLSRTRAWSVAVAAMAAAEAGRMAEAQEYLRKAATAYGSREWYTGTHHCTWAHGVLEYVGGNPAAAIATLDHTASRLLAMRALPLAAFVLTDLAEVAGVAGDASAAAVAAARLGAIELDLERDLYSALAALSVAWRDLAHDETNAAAGHARQAVALPDGRGYRAFYGRALEVLGRSLANIDREAAVAALATADEAFHEAGAVWRRRRIKQHLLTRLGHPGRRKLFTGLGLESLSRRESQVVTLAAKGMTAREIGQRLFIGQRTVETHLANAYAKLGVESKLDLVRRAPELGL